MYASFAVYEQENKKKVRAQDSTFFLSKINGLNPEKLKKSKSWELFFEQFLKE